MSTVFENISNRLWIAECIESSYIVENASRSAESKKLYNVIPLCWKFSY